MKGEYSVDDSLLKLLHCCVLHNHGVNEFSKALLGQVKDGAN